MGIIGLCLKHLGLGVDQKGHELSNKKKTLVVAYLADNALMEQSGEDNFM